MERSSKSEIGFAAESAVAEALKKSGFGIIERNYYSRFGELDIIAEDGELLVFVEVKYRKSCKFGTPAEAVTLKKQKRIIKTAAEYLYKKGIEGRPVRFDVAEVFGNGEIRIIKGAFELTGMLEDCN